MIFCYKRVSWKEERMKKITLVFLILWAVPVAASDISFAPTTTQGDFRNISEDLGSILIYRSIGPAVSLGITGFNLGAEVSASDIDENKGYWKKAVSDRNPPSYLTNTRVTFTKGLPLDLDVGIVLGKVLEPEIPYFGAEVRYAILKDKALVPGLHIRGSYSQTFDVNQLDLRTYALDLSVSKGFGVGIKITPYAGVGVAWVSSKASHLAPGLNLDKEEFSQAHGFLGARLALGILAITAEVDYGAIPSYSLQFGFAF
jgi:opacity protein-like surface antigen